MKLRSGKVINRVVFSDCENAIIFDIKKLIKTVDQLNLYVDSLDKNQIFIEKIRLLSELYYLIDYYDLKNNKKFVKFIEGAKDKAFEIIAYITNFMLCQKERVNEFKLSKQDYNAADYLLQFCKTFVQN